jgi:catechol 2,3-dioxygenase-like lactoylglutathione lyase family enzyme
MISPIAIDHITIIIADLEKTKEFYVDKLGMQQVARPDFDFPGIWFQAGSTQIHATVQSLEAGKAGIGDRENTVISRGHHFAFTVADCFSEAEKLKDLDIEILHGPKQRPDGAVQVYFADPDGHIVELVSTP